MKLFFFGSKTFLLAAISTAFGLMASGAALAGAVDDLRNFLGNSQTARGEFTQRIERSNGKAVVSAGVFSMHRPARFRWEIQKPAAQLMLGDGEKIYFHDKDLNQVTVRKSSDAMLASPAGLLFGAAGSAALDARFTLTEVLDKATVEKTTDRSTWVQAIPKTKDSGFEKILVSLVGGLPSSLEVIDALGQRTIILFKNLQVGVKVEPGEFRFVLPSGADLIQQ